MPVWPWTVSVEGTHVWFENAGQAQRHVFRNFRNGVRNFAIGCFQINYLSGSSAFSSIEDMFNPVLNAQYAARRLQTHYNQLGNWPAATQAFRQNGRSYAKRHISRFAVQGEAKKLLSSRSHALETERFPLLFGHGFPLEAPTSEPIAQRPTGSLFIAATEG
ncbi:MAG: transglycosylase SLT domain-containing protein [Sulfitobacter sp.]